MGKKVPKFTTAAKKTPKHTEGNGKKVPKMAYEKKAPKWTPTQVPLGPCEIDGCTEQAVCYLWDAPFTKMCAKHSFAAFWPPEKKKTPKHTPTEGADV